MKVFNLACESDHRFEGWFASADDYDAQLARGLIECPMCGARSIRKLPSAPRLNLSAESAPSPGATTQPAHAAKPPTREQVQQMWIQMARRIVENTEDVGERFVEEARKIHYNEAPSRGIRGMASPREAEQLNEEGIEVFSFPMPKIAKEPLQ